MITIYYNNYISRWNMIISSEFICAIISRPQNLIRSPDKLIFKAYKEAIENDKAGLNNWTTYVKQTLNACGINQTGNEQASVNENNVLK